jgi:acyl carrier protein
LVSHGRDGADQSALTWLRPLVAQLLNVDDREFSDDQPLGELGIDSLTAAEVSLEIEQRAGAYVSLESFLGEVTLAEIARKLADDAFPAARPEAARW